MFAAATWNLEPKVRSLLHAAATKHPAVIRVYADRLADRVCAVVHQVDAVREDFPGGEERQVPLQRAAGHRRLCVPAGPGFDIVVEAA